MYQSWNHRERCLRLVNQIVRLLRLETLEATSDKNSNDSTGPACSLTILLSRRFVKSPKLSGKTRGVLRRTRHYVVYGPSFFAPFDSCLNCSKRASTKQHSVGAVNTTVGRNPELSRAGKISKGTNQHTEFLCPNARSASKPLHVLPKARASGFPTFVYNMRPVRRTMVCQVERSELLGGTRENVKRNRKRKRNTVSLRETGFSHSAPLVVARGLARSFGGALPGSLRDLSLIHI